MIGRALTSMTPCSLLKHARQPPTDEQVSLVRRRVCLQDLVQPVPRRQRRIDGVHRPYGLVERDQAARFEERDGLGEDLIGLGDVDQHQPRRDEVEGATWQRRVARVAALDLNVGQVALRCERAREFACLLAALYLDDAAGRSDAFGERIEAALRTTADPDRMSAIE